MHARAQPPSSVRVHLFPPVHICDILGMYLLKEEREISRWWDDMVCLEVAAAANSAFEEFKAEQAALAKKAQPQVGNLY
jgi:hypothetical protein